MSHTETYDRQPILLKTARPVVPRNPSNGICVPAIEAALGKGTYGFADRSRPDFYEIEDQRNWYYIHIPESGRCVYLVATGTEPGGLAEPAETAFLVV